MAGPCEAGGLEPGVHHTVNVGRAAKGALVLGLLLGTIVDVDVPSNVPEGPVTVAAPEDVAECAVHHFVVDDIAAVGQVAYDEVGRIDVHVSAIGRGDGQVHAADGLDVLRGEAQGESAPPTMRLE